MCAGSLSGRRFQRVGDRDKRSHTEGREPTQGLTVELADATGSRVYSPELLNVHSKMGKHLSITVVSTG